MTNEVPNKDADDSLTQLTPDLTATVTNTDFEPNIMGEDSLFYIIKMGFLFGVVATLIVGAMWSLMIIGILASAAVTGIMIASLPTLSIAFGAIAAATMLIAGISFVASRIFGKPVIGHLMQELSEPPEIPSSGAADKDTDPSNNSSTNATTAP